jgi:hypothetical protein
MDVQIPRKKLVFMDMTIQIEGSKIITTIYAKPLALYQYIPPNSSQVRPRRVRPVRWQIKGCQTTEPRTFDSGFSGKVNLSLLVLWYTYVPTYFPVCTLLLII